jgi:hypothetical protein
VQPQQLASQQQPLQHLAVEQQQLGPPVSAMALDGVALDDLPPGSLAAMMGLMPQPQPQQQQDFHMDPSSHGAT